MKPMRTSVCVEKKWFFFLILSVFFIGIFYISGVVTSLRIYYQSKAAPANTENKIYGGKEQCDSKKWPFIVYVSGFMSCTGSLISRNWVLTATHCVYDASSGRKMAAVKINDELYDVLDNGIFPNNDITLLQLARNVPFSERSKTITLNFDSDFHYGEKQGKPYGLLLGYGSTELHKASSTCFSEAIAPLRFDIIGYTKNDTMIAVGYPKGRVGGCFGDSGGPLLSWDADKKKWIQIGVTSGGVGECGGTGSYTTFTRVSSYREWISKHVSEFRRVECKDSEGRKKCVSVLNPKSGDFYGIEPTAGELEEFDCRMNNGPHPTWLPKEYLCGNELADIVK